MMENKSYQDLKRDLGQKVSPYRFEHTLRVVETALELAEKHGLDLEKTRKAALLHDYAKDMSDQDLLALVTEAGFELSDLEKRDPSLLHGLAAAIIAQEDLGIEDTEVLDAIRYHTTGRPNFSQLGKLIFVADLIEPGRNYPGLDKFRKMASEDLDQAYLATLNSLIEFILRRGLLLHPLSIEARNDFIMRLENKK